MGARPPQARHPETVTVAGAGAGEGQDCGRLPADPTLTAQHRVPLTPNTPRDAWVSPPVSSEGRRALLENSPSTGVGGLPTQGQGSASPTPATPACWGRGGACAPGRVLECAVGRSRAWGRRVGLPRGRDGLVTQSTLSGQDIAGQWRPCALGPGLRRGLDEDMMGPGSGCCGLRPDVPSPRV